MTGFEKYIQENGGKLISGKPGSFNTYDNIQRTWIVGETQALIQIGLFHYQGKTIIGVIRPFLDFLPTEEEFEEKLFFLSGINVSENFHGEDVKLFKEA